MQWHYTDADNNPVGPISEEEIKAAVADGTVTPTTMVWNEGMADWVPLSESTLAASNGQPPPLPSDACCSQCRQEFAPSDLVRIEGHQVCAGCKPTFLQLLREGGSLLADGGTGETPATELIQRAKDTVRGTWWPSFGTLLLAYIVMMAPMVIPIVGPIALMVVMPALIAGVVRYFVLKARGEFHSVGTIFSGFSRMGAAWVVGFLMYMVNIVAFIPYIICIALLMPGMTRSMSQGSTFNFASMGGLMAVAMLCGLLAMALLLRFAMAFPIVLDDRMCGPVECMKRSATMMAGQKWKFFVLLLRMFWWLFLLYLGALAATVGVGIRAEGFSPVMIPFILILIGVAIEYIRRIPIAFTAYGHFYEDVRGKV